MTRDEIGKKISDNIRAERNRKDYTQEEIAKKLKITTRTYISYEQNAKTMDVTKMMLLSNILECNINDFFVGINFTKCEIN